jgi:hypothetical protein
MSLRYSREGWFGWPGERPNVGFWVAGHGLGTMAPRTLPAGLRPPAGGGAPAAGAPGPGSGFLPRIAVSAGQIACFGLFSRDPR